MLKPLCQLNPYCCRINARYSLTTCLRLDTTKFKHSVVVPIKFIIYIRVRGDLMQRVTKSNFQDKHRFARSSQQFFTLSDLWCRFESDVYCWVVVLVCICKHFSTQAYGFQNKKRLIFVVFSILNDFKT